MNWNRNILVLSIGALWIVLAGCDRASLERTFSADPKASQWNAATPAPIPLPTGFPEALRYPNAMLKKVSPLPQPPSASTEAAAASQGYQTQWITANNPAEILKFYRARLQATPWQGFQEGTGDGVTVLSAQLQTQQVSISVPLSSSSAAQPSAVPADVEFSLTYQTGVAAVVSNGSTPGAASGLFADLSQVPQSLQPYIKDVAQLEVLKNSGGAPNQAISRARFAQWLVELNNRIYGDRPARQIRPVATAAKSAFSDVPTSHPAFSYIQGLAESGYLPSALSGDTTQTRFRPNDPLTRETLLLWKVPIDRQQILPTASSERVKQLWGFKDASRIMPTALSAVASDHQNGELSNIRRVLGSTLLFQPQKPVTYAEAVVALWFIGIEGDSLSVQDLLRSEQQQEQKAVSGPSPSPKPDAQQ
jgi:S-layer homology domain